MNLSTAIPRIRDGAAVHTSGKLDRFRWPIPLQVVTLVALSVALFAEPLLRLVEMREGNGYAHVEFAQNIGETHVLYPGHFLYHLLTAAVQGLLPISWLQAHLIVLLALRAILAFSLWSLIRRSLQAGDSANDALLTITLALSLMFVSAVSFISWGQGNYYLGYIVPNIYVSQTLLALQPLALLTFFAVIQVLVAPLRPGPSIGAVSAMAVLAALSTLAKPSFAMVLLPAVGIFLLLKRQLFVTVVIPRIGVFFLLGRWLRDIKSVLILGVGLVLPVLLAMGWVYFSTFLTYQQVNVTQDTGIRLAPFSVMAYFQSLYVPDSQVPFWLLAKFLLSILFPSVVAITYFSQVRHDPRLVLAWLQFAFGLFFMYFLAEHPTSTAGNFTWSAHIALFILFVVSALFLIEQTMAGGQSRWRAVVSTRAASLCYVVFLLHLVGGYGMFMHPAVN